MWDWLRKLKKKISHEVAPRKVVGYYNGPCPLCNEPIGTDITEGVRKDKSALCGACGAEIYGLLDISAHT